MIHSLEMGPDWNDLAYPALLTSGVLLFFLLTFAEARRRGLGSRQIALGLAVSYLAGLVGARLMFVLEHQALFSSTISTASLEPTGFSAFGALLGASLALAAVSSFSGTPLGLFADSAVTGLCVLVAVGRLGCFWAGCCFGKPTDLPWGVAFPHSSLALSQWGAAPLHPTQLYEAASMLGLGVVFYATRQRSRFSGETFLWLAAAYASIRFLNGFLRGDALVEVAGLPVAQWLALALGSSALLALLILRRKAARPAGLE